MTDDWVTVHVGDCRDILPTLEGQSVHCVVTSPPYWGLRDYGVDGQLGLESTPEEYVSNLVDVFREVRRVLRDDGTVWLNLGDSYNNRNATRRSSHQGGLGFESADLSKSWVDLKAEGRTRMAIENGDLKEKDLVGIPWMVAFALRADGWHLRSDIIWAKPNPMPESVTDRPTKSHEYVFLLSKSARYYFDADAVREAVTPDMARRAALGHTRGANGKLDASRGDHDTLRGTKSLDPSGRNIRSVWTIPTQPYPGAHFAVFPEALVVPCVKAGTSERGCCPECGAPWERVVEREVAPPEVFTKTAKPQDGYVTGYHVDGVIRGAGQKLQAWRDANPSQTTGWRPSCAHVAEPVPCTVLDPFAGSGTVGLVANRLSRRAILIEMNPEYIKQVEGRTMQTPLGLHSSP